MKIYTVKIVPNGDEKFGAESTYRITAADLPSACGKGLREWRKANGGKHVTEAKITIKKEG